jgi:putative oxidoreductase
LNFDLKEKKMKRFLRGIIAGLEKGRWLPLLLFRLILAFGFFGPAMIKLQNIDGVVSFFRELNIPYPAVGAYLAAIFETLGVILLVLGLFTRLISIPLMFMMIVAIITVHWVNGYPAGNNGFQIPLMYFSMLLALFILGPGKVSLDGLIKRKIDQVPPKGRPSEEIHHQEPENK